MLAFLIVEKGRIIHNPGKNIHSDAPLVGKQHCGYSG